VITALRAPSASPLSLDTVSDVDVEAMTVPLPAGVKTTVLLMGMVEKLLPVMVTVVALLRRLAVLLVTDGTAM
jgi:hypothetical protein